MPSSARHWVAHAVHWQAPSIGTDVSCWPRSSTTMRTMFGRATSGIGAPGVLSAEAPRTEQESCASNANANDATATDCAMRERAGSDGVMSRVSPRTAPNSSKGGSIGMTARRAWSATRATSRALGGRPELGTHRSARAGACRTTCQAVHGICHPVPGTGWHVPCTARPERRGNPMRFR